MINNYQKYTSKELLDDDYFICSMINPTPGSDDFWLSLVNDGLISITEFELAKSLIEVMKKPARVMSPKERTDLWVKIEIENKKALRKKLDRRRFYLYSAIASLLIAVFTVSYFFVMNENSPIVMNIKDVMANIPNIDEASNEIQLILPDNEKIELNDKSADIVMEEDGGITINSKKIDRASTKAEKTPATSYNHLIIPFGKHSNLTLSDGTKMYINSGSKVIFPNKFSATERQIFVNGEVYLEVTPNKKVPFFIRTNKMDIQVMGTTVNITAYEQDSKQAVVLVTGSVMVVTEDKHVTQLTPNQMLNYSHGECAVSLVDTYEYTSWKDGYFIYKRNTLENIMKQMSRYYGIEIICDPEIASMTCSGKLDLKEDLDKVMRDLSDILQIDFLFQDNIYTIKKSTNQLKLRGL